MASIDPMTTGAARQFSPGDLCALGLAELDETIACRYPARFTAADIIALNHGGVSADEAHAAPAYLSALAVAALVELNLLGDSSYNLARFPDLRDLEAFARRGISASMADGYPVACGAREILAAVDAGLSGADVASHSPYAPSVVASLLAATITSELLDEYALAGVEIANLPWVLDNGWSADTAAEIIGTLGESLCTSQADMFALVSDLDAVSEPRALRARLEQAAIAMVRASSLPGDFLEPFEEHLSRGGEFRVSPGNDSEASRVHIGSVEILVDQLGKATAMINGHAVDLAQFRAGLGRV